jgi:hypothetical protein
MDPIRMSGCEKKRKGRRKKNSSPGSHAVRASVPLAYMYIQYIVSVRKEGKKTPTSLTALPALPLHRLTCRAKAEARAAADVHIPPPLLSRDSLIIPSCFLQRFRPKKA